MIEVLITVKRSDAQRMRELLETMRPHSEKDQAVADNFHQAIKNVLELERLKEVVAKGEKVMDEIKSLAANPRFQRSWSIQTDAICREVHNAQIEALREIRRIADDFLEEHGDA